MKYRFSVKQEEIPQPNHYKDFTFGKVYDVYLRDGFKWAVADTGKEVMVSNNYLRSEFWKRLSNSIGI